MEEFEREREDALRRIAASGRDPEAFAFAMDYLHPDPDGGGMFTAQYRVEVTNTRTGKSLKAIGGIGSDWVGYFGEALRDGRLD